MESIQIGSQLLINRTDTPERVRFLVEKMQENGLRLIRLFMVWDDLEPQKGNWNFCLYDVCFETAWLYGMKVVPTLMAVSPPGWMRLTRGPQSTADLDDPSFWNGPAHDYVCSVVQHYAAHPALHSWILWNEPSRVPPDTPFARQAFQRFLMEKYDGDLAQMNARYYEQAESFAQINQVPLHGSSFESYAQRLDTLWFIVDNLDRKLRDLGDWVRENDQRHPIHVNPHNVGQNLLSVGQSIWHQAEYTDFLGCSAHVPWHSGRFPADRRPQSIALYADLMKNATAHPEGQFWVTELQGGPTWFSSPTASCPSGSDISFWLWEAIGSGARAVLFWCFGSRDGGDEAGEWNLLNLLDEPSERLLAARDTADLLMRHQALFDQTRPVSPQVLLLDSQNTAALSVIETVTDKKEDPRNRQMAADALCGAYLCCSDLGLSVEVIPEEKLWTDCYPQNARVLILPETTALDERTVDGMLRFQQQGGLIIADGLCGLKDPDGNIARGRLRKLESLFGMQVVEIYGIEQAVPLHTSSGDFPAWFVRVDARPANGKIAAAFADGAPAAIQLKKEHGGGVRILTAFFRQAMLDTLGDGIVFLHEMFPEEIFQQDIVLLNVSRALHIHRLEHPDGEVLILINTGATDTAVLQFSGDGMLTRLNGEGSYWTDSHSLIGIPVVARTVAVFFWQRNIESGENA